MGCPTVEHMVDGLGVCKAVGTEWGFQLSNSVIVVRQLRTEPRCELRQCRSRNARQSSLQRDERGRLKHTIRPQSRDTALHRFGVDQLEYFSIGFLREGFPYQEVGHIFAVARAQGVLLGS